METIKDKLLGLWHNEFWNKMLKNAIAVFSGKSIASVLNALMVILIPLIFNTDLYGCFVIGQTYMSVIDSIVNFQSWHSVIRYGAFAIEEKNDNKLVKVIKAGLVVDIITCIVGFLLGALGIKLFGYIFHWSKTIQILCFLFSFEILFHVEGTITGILRLFDKFGYIATYSIVAALLKLVAVGIMFLLGIKNIFVFTVVYVIVEIITFMLYVYIGMRELSKACGLKKVWGCKIKGMGKEFWSYTIWSNISVTVDVPIKYFDIFFLSLISTEMVAAYNIFKQMVSVLGLMVTPLSQASMPQFSQLIASKREKEAYHKVLKLRNMILLVLTPVMIAFGLVSPFLLKVIGQEQLVSYLYILYALLVFNICALSYTGLHPLFSAYGFSKQTAYILLVANVIYTLWCALTVRRLQVAGIIIGQFIQFCIVIVWKKYIIKKKVVLGNNT